MDQKVKGSLIIATNEIRFVDEKGTLLISIPIASITGVDASVEHKDASVGSKIAFGFLARSRKDEFVTVSYDATSTVEGVVFRTEKNVSAGVVAKIHFQLKHAGITADSGRSAAVVIAPSPDGTSTQP